MSAAGRARVTIVTSGHPSSCPRMLKSADALAADGYDIRVIATRHEPWATETDRDVASRRSWVADTVDYRRGDSGSTYWWTGARYRAARAAVSAIGPDRAPLSLVSRAFGRVHSELVRAIVADPGDLIYGGTTGALAAVAEAATQSGTPYALDLEDFHSGETAGADAPLVDALAMRVEHAVLPGALFVTSASEAIAGAYRNRDGLESTVIHNTFALPSRSPDEGRLDPARLRIYWFSQTIGPGRGLEDAILALGRAGAVAHLALRGRPHAGYLETITALAAAHAPGVEVAHLPPGPPDAMVDLARGYDIGLALEQMSPLGRQLCLTNKVFTYILAGAAVVITDTPGQRALAADLGRGAALVPPGDVEALAGAFARWAGDPAALDCARRTAWQAAARRWHWEHEAERGALLALVREALA
jgi:glycosyltransferase involved in cell wall biosynthesis